MQRDMSILRKVLFVAESEPDTFAETLDRIGFYHLDLARQAGLIQDYALTLKGHDFLDLARDAEMWQWTTCYIKERVGTAPFDIWLDVLRLAQQRRLF